MTHLIVVFALTAGAAPARAQENGSQNAGSRQAVEVTPYVSLGSVGSSRVGAAIRFAWTSRVSAELEVGYRRGEIDALSSNLSVVYDLPRVRRLTPYLATGIGLDQYATALYVPEFGVVTQPRIALTVNAGGGVRTAVGDNWGIRTDARWFNGLGSQAPEQWRLYNGVTFGRSQR